MPRMTSAELFDLIDAEESDFCSTHRMDVTEGEFDYWHEVFDLFAGRMIAGR